MINRNLVEDADCEDVSVCGRIVDLYFRETKMLTITDARWLSYHIELSPRLRKPGNGLAGRPAAFAYRFADHLAAALSDKNGLRFPFTYRTRLLMN